jgi:hypothetical protein
MHLTPLRGPRSVEFCDVISCQVSLPSIGAAQVMPKALDGKHSHPIPLFVAFVLD